MNHPEVPSAQKDVRPELKQLEEIHSRRKIICGQLAGWLFGQKGMRLSADQMAIIWSETLWRLMKRAATLRVCIDEPVDQYVLFHAKYAAIDVVFRSSRVRFVELNPEMVCDNRQCTGQSEATSNLLEAVACELREQILTTLDTMSKEDQCLLRTYFRLILDERPRKALYEEIRDELLRVFGKVITADACRKRLFKAIERLRRALELLESEQS